MAERFDVLHMMWRGEIGGAERAVFQLALHQHVDGRRRVALGYGQARGHWVERAREAGIPVVHFDLRSGHDFARGLARIPMLRRARIHHFHYVELPLVVASSLTPGALRVYTHRGGFRSYGGRSAARYRIAGALFRRGFAVTGNTAHAAASANRLFRMPPAAPVRTTYNGLDFDLLVPARGRAQMRRELGAADGDVLIGTAANLREWKRVDWLIEAAARIGRDRWTIYVLGDGPDRARLERLAAASPVAQRIRFAGRQEAIADWLVALDVFTLPSGPGESFGNAAVEAMAQGLPTLVAQDSPGLVEHVPPGIEGFTFRDPEDLGERLTALVADPGARERMGRIAREHVRATYTMKRCVERYESVYCELEGKSGSSSGAS